MKPNQQNTNQQNNQQNNQQTNQQPSQQPAQRPEPASKRDVQEAERKAAEAQRMAAEETESVRQEVQDLREQNQQLREDLDHALAALHYVDAHLDRVAAGSGAWGNGYESEPIAERTHLPQLDELETVNLVDPSEQEE